MLSKNSEERTLKTCFLNNLEKDSLTAQEIYQSLSSSIPLNIIKVSFKDRIDNQSRSNGVYGYKIKTEPGYNDVTTHEFLNNFIFKDRQPIIFERPEEGQVIEIGAEERELQDLQNFISMLMSSYTYKANNETKKLYSLKETIAKIKGPPKNMSSGLSSFKEKEKNVELELWASEFEAQKFHNSKHFISNNYPIFLNFNTKESNKEQTNTNNENNKEKKDENLNDKKKELKIIGLNKQFERENVTLFDLDFGELLPNENTFSSFFSFSLLKAAWKELNIPGVDDMIPELFYFKLEKSKSQKLFIIIPLIYSYELKIEFSYKFCKEVFFERENEDFINLYVNLLIPPRIYLQNPNKSQYEAPNLRLSWPRVHNFFLIENHLIDEIHKIYLTNNTVLRIKLHKKHESSLLDFQEKVKVMNLLKPKKKKSIEYKLYERDHALLSENFLKNLKFKDEKTSFNIQYNILCLLTENKISIHDPEVIEIIKIMPELDGFVTEATLEDLIKLLNRGFFSDEDNSFQEIFQNLYKRKKRDKGLNYSDSLFHILKTRKLTLTPSGVLFGVKEPEMSNRVLRKYEKYLDLFMRMKFSDDDMDDTKNMRFVIYKYFKPKLENFLILNRKYEFMAFSASQLRTSACWLFAGDPTEITAEEIVQSLGKFHDKIPAKKAARIGQSFSASFPVVLEEMESKPIIKEENDLSNGKTVYSDGIGRISQDLIDQICAERKLPSISAVQIRFGGAKGVLAVDPEMKEKRTIYLRPSMIKFDGKYANLELLDYNKYRGGYLNRQIILLLLTLGIKGEVFKELQSEYLQDLDNAKLKDANIFQYFNAEYEGSFVEMPPVTVLIRKMKNAKLSLKEDPFICGIERTLRLRGLLLLKKKSNILVKNAARLLGVLDEYGVLEEDEVFVSVQNLQAELKENIQSFEVEGEVMVTRNPCLHPGDIRVLKAVRRKQLSHFVNCIVFPRKGQRSLPSMISGGDLDGDLYFVSWDKRLIPDRLCDPMSYEAKKPEEFKEKSEDISLKDMLEFFIRYMTFDNLGRIANSHLALADQSPKLAFDDRCLRLSELHSDAVDFVKTGYCVETIDRTLLAKEWPDFMEKKDYLIIYESETVLGELFRETKAIIKGKKESGEISEEQNQLDEDYPVDLSLVYDKWEGYLDFALKLYEKFYFEMTGLLNLFGVRNEFEVYSGNFSKFIKSERRGKANVEILQKRVLSSIAFIKKRLEKLFVEKDENNQEALKSKASAVYIVTYLNKTHENIAKYKEIFSKVFNNEKWISYQENFKIKLVGLPWMISSEWLLKIKREKIEMEKKDVEKTNKVAVSKGNIQKISELKNSHEVEDFEEPEFLN